MFHTEGKQIEPSRETGGYYAIKGFVYQIDVAILEIIDTKNNEPIYVEEIQDINSDGFVMQVKHKETQNYSGSKIREPLLQLIEEFQHYPSKSYRLHCHFKDKGEETIFLDIDELNDILKPIDGESKKSTDINLRIANIKNEVRVAFIKKFEMFFSPKFQRQFDDIIEKIKGLSVKNTSYDEAVLYYSWIYQHILHKITSNHDGESFTKSGVRSLINDGTRVVFDSSYSEYIGQGAYLKLVKTRFIKLKKNRNNFIILNLVLINPSVTISDMIREIIDKYYLNAVYNIKPLNFIVNDDYAGLLKKELCGAEELFNDGYEHIEFNPNIFNLEPINNRKTRGSKKIATDSLDKTSFKCRVLSQSTYKNFKDSLFDPDMTYVLGERLHDQPQEPYLLLESLDSKELLTLFNS